MKIHEYQAKDILKAFGVAVPNGRVATTADEARAIAEELGGRAVVKAQVHAGGRGKAGGVKVVRVRMRRRSSPRACSGRTSSPRRPARRVCRSTRFSLRSPLTSRRNSI